MSETIRDRETESDITVCTVSSLKQTFSKTKNQPKCIKSFYKSSKIIKVKDEIDFKSEKIEETIRNSPTNSDLDETSSDFETNYELPNSYHGKSISDLETKRYYMKKELERINWFMKKVQTNQDKCYQSSSKETCQDDPRSSDKINSKKNKSTDLSGKSVSTQRISNVDEDKPKKILNCRLCDYKSLNPRAYKKHLVRHNTSKPFACPKCPKIFLRRCSVVQHMKTHYDKRSFGENKAKVSPKRKRNVFRCDKCSFLCNVKYELVEHSSTHEEYDNHKCRYCDFTSRRLEAMKSHVKTIHSKDYIKKEQEFFDQDKEAPSNEETLQVTQNQPTELIKEEISEVKSEIHKNDRCSSSFKAYRCYMCPFVTKTFAELENHKIEVHKKKFKCNLCGARYSLGKSLKAHLLNHAKNFIYLICQVCSKLVKGKTALRNHMIKFHNHPTFKDEQESDNPLNLVDQSTEDVESTSVDDIESNRTISKLENEDKIENNAGGSKHIFGCNNYNFQTTINSDLKNHKTKAHKSIKMEDEDDCFIVEQEVALYRCKHCPKTYKTERCFQKHIEIHKDYDERILEHQIYLESKLPNRKTSITVSDQINKSRSVRPKYSMVKKHPKLTIPPEISVKCISKPNEERRNCVIKNQKFNRPKLPLVSINNRNNVVPDYKTDDNGNFSDIYDHSLSRNAKFKLFSHNFDDNESDTDEVKIDSSIDEVFFEGFSNEDLYDSYADVTEIENNNSDSEFISKEEMIKHFLSLSNLLN